MPEYGRLDGVELISAGMDWPAVTGPVTVTLEHIAAMVAAQDDPHVQPPRVRLGHFSVVNDGIPQWDPFAAIGDAEPSFGHWENLRSSNDGATLVGDAVEVPMWLVDAAPSAFPSRSAETLADVVTPGGKRYAAVCTGVALLGAYLPAVSDLDDLQRVLEFGPDLSAASAAASNEESILPASALSVSTDVIRRRLNTEWAVEDPLGLGTYWWWVRDVRVDPDEAIVDDDEGGLWSIPFATDGADVVTFGAPVRVRQDFVPVAAAAARVEGAVRTIASFSRPSAAEKTAVRPHPTAASRPNHEESPMDENVRRNLAAAHGLDPDTATEQQVNEAVLAATPPLTDPPAPVDPAAQAPVVPGATDVVTPEPGVLPVAPAAPAVAPAQENPVAVAASRALAEATARVAELERRENERETQAVAASRDTKVTGWVAEGRIDENERSHYRNLLDIDETATVALAADLSPGRIPVLQRTRNTAVAASTGDGSLLASTLKRLGVKPIQEV